MAAVQTTLLHLSLIKGVGPAVCTQLVRTFGSEGLSGLYHMSLSNLQRIGGLSAGAAQTVINGLADSSLLEKELVRIDKNQVSWCTFIDDSYPPDLKEIHLPPVILYYKGSFETKNALAVVGSRAADEYAQKVIDILIPELVAYRMPIVSGGAIGADTMAHRAALHAGGKTIAILGSGLAHLYPYANKKLFAQIIDAGGAVVSPFSVDTLPHPGNFPARNRVIAGISRGCLVVQAAQESGARITALFALEQGREVCAVPGSIFNPLSAGCHDLIKQGATVVQSAADILQALNLSADKKAEPLQLPTLEQQSLSLPSKASDNLPLEQADLPLARKIIALCKKPQSIDALLDQLDQDMPSMQAALFDLQLCGALEQNAAGLWYTVRP
jgi:DNA processing protein